MNGSVLKKNWKIYFLAKHLVKFNETEDIIQKITQDKESPT